PGKEITGEVEAERDDWAGARTGTRGFGTSVQAGMSSSLVSLWSAVCSEGAHCPPCATGRHANERRQVMDNVPAERSSTAATIVLVVVLGGILALASWISGFPWNLF